MPESSPEELTLAVPEAPKPVKPEVIERDIAVDDASKSKVTALATTFTTEIAAIDIHGDEYRRHVDEVERLATREMRLVADMSNRLLDRPTRAMSSLGDGKDSIAKSLVDLRRSVEELNPAKYDLHHKGGRKMLGVIPFGDQIKSYFAKFQKSRSHIEAIVGALTEGGQELEKDNLAIGQEEKSLWTQMETLRQYALLAEQLDTSLEHELASIEPTDPDKAKTLREDVLFPVRHRRQEILTQLAIAMQGYAALRVVELNNKELVRAVHTATTTTVSALRTAVMVAQALENQRLVSEQVRAVNETTSSMIESTSESLREQGSTIESQATSPGIDMNSLQRAWDNVFAALEQIDTYKLRALDAMKVTVQELSTQMERSKDQVDRLHDAASHEPTGAGGGTQLRIT